MNGAPDAAFEALLEFLKRTRGLDFTGYRRTSLERRMRRRMDTVDCDGFSDYLDYIEVHPDEYAQLFDVLLINVTQFFRDPPAWDHLREEILPALIEAKDPDEPLRVWSAGCASGQEAYTIAMAFAELLGEDALRERVKIYATDIDEDALGQGRLAVYNAKETESVPDDLREKYFERVDQKLAFRKDLRRAVIFGRNNLVQDAPISRLDLLVCRNTLMYFNAETQARILRHFHFALNRGGVLMLGKSEMMISHRDLFSAADLRRRIFSKRLTTGLANRLSAIGAAETPELPGGEDERDIRDAALELGSHPQIIVSRTGRLTFANVSARALFGIPLADIGRPFMDLGLSHRPTELAGPVEQALRERRRVLVGETTFTPDRGDPRRLDISVAPLLSAANVALGAYVTFEDVTRFAVLQSELEGNRRDLELAYEELQSTIDELETTNEELQSANEELQSTNEELETINDELRERTGELNEVNDFLEAILTSLGMGVAVLDAQQRVQVWNHHAEDVWGLRSDEAVDHHFLSLDIGLPSEQLAAPLRAVLNGASTRESHELEAINRRGRPIVCAATVLPLIGDDRVRGAIVMMEDRPAD